MSNRVTLEFDTEDDKGIFIQWFMDMAEEDFNMCLPDEAEYWYSKLDKEKGYIRVKRCKDRDEA